MALFGQKKPMRVEVLGDSLRCQICDHDRFWQREGQLNTAVASFFNFEWTNPSAACFICDACGYVHWFFRMK